MLQQISTTSIKKQLIQDIRCQYFVIILVQDIHCQYFVIILIQYIRCQYFVIILVQDIHCQYSVIILIQYIRCQHFVIILGCADGIIWSIINNLLFISHRRVSFKKGLGQKIQKLTYCRYL